MKPENNSPNNSEKVLTSIHGMYTLPYTQEYSSEVDMLTVKNFLNTLAEIALAIASRKDQEVKQ
jgi:hypothetical protein